MCPYCEKTFKTNSNCKKHLKIHKLELTMQAVRAAGESLQGDQQQAIKIFRGNQQHIQEILPSNATSVERVSYATAPLQGQDAGQAATALSTATSQTTPTKRIYLATNVTSIQEPTVGKSNVAGSSSYEFDQDEGQSYLSMQLAGNVNGVKMSMLNVKEQGIVNGVAGDSIRDRQDGNVRSLVTSVESNYTSQEPLTITVSSIANNAHLYSSLGEAEGSPKNSSIITTKPHATAAGATVSNTVNGDGSSSIVISSRQFSSSLSQPRENITGAKQLVSSASNSLGDIQIKTPSTFFNVTTISEEKQQKNNNEDSAKSELYPSSLLTSNRKVITGNNSLHYNHNVTPGSVSKEDTSEGTNNEIAFSKNIIIHSTNSLSKTTSCSTPIPTTSKYYTAASSAVHHPVISNSTNSSSVTFETDRPITIPGFKGAIKEKGAHQNLQVFYLLTVIYKTTL